MIFSPVLIDNLPFCLAVLAGVLFWLGGRQRLMLISSAGVRPARSRRRTWRSIAFYSSLVVTVFALQPPMDGWADSLFWAHMVQHQLLMMLSAPLLVISAPWIRMWSGFPLGFRRMVARSVVQGDWARPVRATAHAVGSPAAAWIGFNAVIIGWHVPTLYDAAVSNQLVHDVEHLTFVLFAIVFWAQLIDSPPFRARLDYMRRFFYLAASMFPSWVLAIIMVFSGAPLYPAYVVRESGQSGIGVLTDQQVGGAIMWMVGSIPMAITGFWLIYQWVASSEEPGRLRGRRRVSAVDLADESVHR
ncbi:MAG TPA: cytochrome c oxidase assembly protein [Candidatus Dormibacteraeota bacterium]|jgi:putative membrane protein|nr:cytochrome c oxidase assembly protein [Candidatus Dormibacteraeota bacterium]